MAKIGNIAVTHKTRQKSIIHSIGCLLLMGVISSCAEQIMEDPADKFVGTYSYDDTYFVTWGSSSGSLSDSGTFTITKTGPSTIKLSNPWNTTGSVTGMFLNLDPVTQGDNTGYINYAFTSASLAGNMLSITYQGVGSLRHSDGRNYPYSCQGNITARKKQ